MASLVPSEPPNDLRVDNISSNEITIKWRPPDSKTINGELEGYYITYRPTHGPTKEINLSDPNKTVSTLS